MTPGNQDSNAPDTVVLIHGLWMTPLSWEHWVKRYSDRGYRVVARAWPGMDVDIDELRRKPELVAGLAVNDIVEHYERIIRELDRPPIIMGHSFGGLFTQILLDRGLGAAGVAIASAPVKGILRLPFSSLRSAFPALSNPLNFNRAAPLTPDQFHYTFGPLTIATRCRGRTTSCSRPRWRTSTPMRRPPWTSATTRGRRCS